jgi:RNA polymerase sigma-70 factor (ECF subfamily)
VSEFDRFFRAHAAGVWNFLVRFTGDRERAADVFQKSFLKAYTHFGERRAAASEKAWVFTIAANEARDEARRKGRDRLRPMDLPELRAEGDPAVSAEERELAREILRGIGELPEPQRELYLLVRYHGLGFAEAARACGLGLSAAKMAVARAHGKLMKLLEGRIGLRSLL